MRQARAPSLKATFAWAVGVALLFTSFYISGTFVDFTAMMLLALGGLFIPLFIAAFTAGLVARDGQSQGHDLLRLTEITPRALADSYFAVGGYRTRRYWGIASGLLLPFCIGPLVSAFIWLAQHPNAMIFSTFYLEWPVLSVMFAAGMWAFNPLAVALGVRVGLMGMKPGNAAALAFIYMVLLMALLAGMAVAMLWFKVHVISPEVMRYGYPIFFAPFWILQYPLLDFMLSSFISIFWMQWNTRAMLRRRGWGKPHPSDVDLALKVQVRHLIPEGLDWRLTLVVLGSLGLLVVAVFLMLGPAFLPPEVGGGTPATSQVMGTLANYIPSATLSPTLTQVPTSAHTATPTATQLPGSLVRNGVEMVRVPAGCFLMGSAEREGVFQHCFDAPFWIDRYEVTNAQFRRLGGVAADAGRFPGPNHPRDSVSWLEARDFCTLRGARLPTEAEWEYAARGPDSLIYPWGNDFVADNVVYVRNSGYESAEVGSRPGGVSWVGAYDLSGNLWEWTSTIDRPYPYSALDGREDSQDQTAPRIIRGGAWGVSNTPLQASLRVTGAPNSHNAMHGFRCVSDG